MLAAYRDLFALPGARWFTSAGVLGRLSRPMFALGVLTMVSETTGRYGLAGTLTAALQLSTAAIGPQISRFVDRYGQRRVLRPAAAVTVAAAGALLLCFHLGAPDWSLFVCAVPVGTMPSVGAMTRARWTAVCGNSPQLLHTAYSLESVLDEAAFIVAPMFSIELSALWFPTAGPLWALGFLIVGVLMLTVRHAVEPPPHPRRSHRGPALNSFGLRVLVATCLGTGIVFGGIEVATVASARSLGDQSAAGQMLAAFALGACVSSSAFGLLRTAREPTGRLPFAAAVMISGMIPMQLTHSLASLTAALLVAGAAVAPVSVTTKAAVVRVVPRGRLAESLTWATAGVALGCALGASVSGFVVDATGAAVGYEVPGAAGAVTAAVAFLGGRRLHARLVARHRV